MAHSLRAAWNTRCAILANKPFEKLFSGDTMNEFQKWASLQNWSSVPRDLNFVTMDMSGDIHVFARRPRPGDQFWMQGGDSVYLRGVRGGANGDSLDWKECIYEIPKPTDM